MVRSRLRLGIAALSKEGNEAVARMHTEYDKRRKLMVEMMREVGFGIPVMPQGVISTSSPTRRGGPTTPTMPSSGLCRVAVSCPGADPPFTRHSHRLSRKAIN